MGQCSSKKKRLESLPSHSRPSILRSHDPLRLQVTISHLALRGLPPVRPK